MGYGIKYRTLSKIMNYFFPNYFAQQIMDELVIFKTKGLSKKTLKKYKGQEDIKINIGCGPAGKPGWANLDAMPFPGTDVWDCKRSLPFADGSSSAIYSEHFLEHIDYYEDAPLLLKDIYRVLKPNGVVRIIVPDAQKYIESYGQEGWDSIGKTRALLKDNIDPYSGVRMNTKMELVNWIFRQTYQHKFAYDFETLSFRLKEAGFRKIIKQEFNISLSNDLKIDTPYRESESLYVEAVKE